VHIYMIAFCLLVYLNKKLSEKLTKNLTKPTCIQNYNYSATISKITSFCKSLVDIKKHWKDCNILRMSGRYFISEILYNLNIYIYTAAYVIFRSHLKIIRPINND
jgi:hypothetical protein